MTSTSVLHQQILEQVKELPEKEKREVLNFIEYLKIREDRAFIDYVNKRTQEAVEARNRGERFTSLKELQQEYA
jgi:hypothetical protein